MVRIATEAAILSVLLSANTTEATAKLTKYQKQLDKAEVQAKRGINTRLGATFNDDAFKRYQAATTNAARKAADRRAFKAELGANFSSAGFRAYERELNAAAAATAAKSAQMRDTLRRNFAQAGQYAAIGIGVAGVAAGKLVIDFDRAMRNVNSIAQLPERQFKALEKSVLSLAGKTAQAPKTLAEGLYDLVSSGFDAKQSMLILASSAKAATAGLTDTATSTKAVAAVLNAYHRPAKDAAAVSDTLFETVNLGVITFEQLSNTIGDVLPFASQLHVSLNQVGAAVATMTKAGIGPEETMTRLKNVMVAFLKPSKDMAAAIKATGFESGETLIKQKGLQGALEALVGTTDGTKSAIAALFPNIRGLGGALALTGSNAKGADKDLKAFSNTSGATNKALSQQAQSVSYQWQKLRATVEAMAISFANKAIPVVLKFVQQMKDGAGAGGQFASAMKTAFTTVKNVVHFAVDELGGLKTAIEVLVGGYAIKRILNFAGALGGIGKGASGAAGAVGATGATGILGRLGSVLSKASAFSLLLPIGIAFGAVLNNWMNKNAEAEGKRFADKFLAPMPDAIKQKIGDALTKQAQRAIDLTHQATTPRAGASTPPGVRRIGRGPSPTGAMFETPQALTAQQTAAFQLLGQQAGEAAVAGLRSVHDVSGPILLQDFLGRLKTLPALARPEAAKAMLAFAESLQQQGKLPAKAFQSILHSLEAQLPGFDFYLQKQGLASDLSFAKALKFTTATNTLRNTLANYRQQFGDWTIATKITGSNIVQNMATAMQHLHQTVKTSTGQTRKDAIDEIKKLHDQATSLFSSMASKTAQAAKDMQGSITSQTSQAARNATSNLSGLANAIYGGVRSGAINSKQGAQYIQQALNATLKAFGATPIPAVTLKDVALSTPFSSSVGAFPKSGQAGGGGKPVGAARGALMQIGKYGQAGRDSVPLNVGGMPISVAPGEQVAVFNRHQLPIVNRALASMGGLPGLFSKVRTPNYMAGGGMVPKFAGGGALSYGQLEGLWDQAGGPRSVASVAAAIALAESGGRDVMQQGQPFATTGWGYWQITPGGPQYLDPMTNARAAVAKYTAAGGFSPWTTFNSGAYKAFLSGAAPVALGALAQQINAPKVLGGGTLGTILKAVFGKEASAANAFLSRLAPAPGAVGALPGGLGGSLAHQAYAALRPGRTDQGVDFGGTGPVGAVLAGRVLRNTIWPGWPGSGGAVYSTGRGNVYVMEDFAASVPVGAALKAGQIIGRALGGPSGIETGWANAAGTGPLTPYNGAPDGTPMPGGRAFRSFIGYARGGLLPYAGSFAGGGIVPGPLGKASLAMVHGGEGVVPAFARGGDIVGRALAAHPNWLPPNAQKAIANALASALVGSLAGIPSQGTAGQIQLQGLQNTLTSAQNVGNVGGQRSALNRILTLERGWLTADRAQLKKINKALRKRGLSKKQRGQLLQDKLALLQEIGTVEADIGSTQTSLSDLTPTDTSGGDTGAGGGVDAGTQALTDAYNAMAQALTDATAAISQQTAAINGIGAIEKHQAIKALADVISGQIGGNYLSRSTGSAGDGSVARY